MDTNIIKGKLKELTGEIQEHLGRWMGNSEQEQKGHAREQEGKDQQRPNSSSSSLDTDTNKPSNQTSNSFAPISSQISGEQKTPNTQTNKQFLD